MPTYLLFIFVGLLVVGLIVWRLAVRHRSHLTRKAAFEQLGFLPCPDQKSWLEETVIRIESNRIFRYEVREPKRMQGEPALYYYTKKRHWYAQEDSVEQEEILFSLKRPSVEGLVLIVKPSSLTPGLAMRALSAIATGPWDTQPDDLQHLELPADLKETNLVAALGPPGSSLYDLVDANTLSVVQGLGDAGGIFVHFRDAWCSVAGAGPQIPFHVDELIARIRPVL